MKYSRNHRNNGAKLVSEINVTPLVDVVLVLLIIFMVTAPMLQMGIDINLPRAKAKSVDVSEEKLILSINKQQDIFINNSKISLSELAPKLENIFKTGLKERSSCERIKTYRMEWLFRSWPKSGRRVWISWE